MAKVIGLTGGIASGKSTITQYLRSKGYLVIDADQVAREVVLPGSPGLAAIAAAFGGQYLDEQGCLKRRQLGELVFADRAQLDKLEAITGPLIEQAIRQKLAASAREAVVFLDAATLIEHGLTGLCDAVWLVAATEAQQLRRLMERDGLSRAAAQNRIASQMPLADKIPHAQAVIDNRGSTAAALAQVDRLLAAL